MKFFNILSVIVNLYTLSYSKLYDIEYIDCLVKNNFNIHYCKELEYLNNFGRLLKENTDNSCNNIYSSYYNSLYNLYNQEDMSCNNQKYILSLTKNIYDCLNYDYDIEISYYCNNVSDDDSIFDISCICINIEDNFEETEYTEEYETEEYIEYEAEEIEYTEYEAEEYETEEYIEYEAEETEYTEELIINNFEIIDNNLEDIYIDLNVIYLTDISLDDNYNLTSLSSYDILSSYIEPVNTLQLKAVNQYEETSNEIYNEESFNEKNSHNVMYLLISTLCIVLIFSIILITIFKIKRNNRIYSLASIINDNDEYNSEDITEESNMI